MYHKTAFSIVIDSPEMCSSTIKYNSEFPSSREIDRNADLFDELTETVESQQRTRSDSMCDAFEGQQME
jgi:HKD family nuclease